MSPEERLFHHTASIGADRVPDAVTERAKFLLLDFLGIAIRGATDAGSSPAGIAALEDLTMGSGGSATVLGIGRKATPGLAALFNGMFAHSLELDDTHRYASLHPGVVVIPAALAAAEADDATGETLLKGIVAGYDVMVRVGRAVNIRNHYQQGFHPTPTCGTFGSIAAVSTVRGRSETVLSNAMGVGNSQPSGMMQYLENGAWNKRLHPGLAAQSGLVADSLAAGGFIGASRPITGQRGFFRGYTSDPDPEELAADLGERYEVTETGIKPYACCRANHSAIDAALVLRDDVDPAAIRRIEVEIYETGMALVGEPIERKQSPDSIVDAQFSLPFAIAVALLYGEPTIDRYDSDLIDDDRVRSLMAKVYPVGSSEYEQAYPEEWPATVRIETPDGTYEREVRLPRGEPERPLSWSDITAKFERMVKSRVEDPEAVVESAKRIEELRTQDLTAHLA